MYPTLCRQAFRLLICKTIDGSQYLIADMQEQCWTGRHQISIYVFTLPQITFHVIGIPLLGLRAAYRAKQVRIKRDTSISLFRYGML